MREILFRGKRTDRPSEWVYGYPFKAVSSVGAFWQMSVPASDPDDNHKIYPINQQTIGQFTGLKDKHGMKIFEGDYIRWSEMQPTKADHDVEELATEDYLVVFENGSFICKPLQARTPAYETFDQFELNEIEVLINIYDEVI